jgi:Protein of unknown function (DUF3800)
VPLIAYLDEAGSASLKKIDPQSPVFALGFLVCDIDRYCSEIVPSMTKLKIETFGHDAVILHSHDIRKKTGDFAVLLNATARGQFFSKLNAIIETAPFELIAVAIHKEKHKAKYGSNAKDPYELALEFGLERIKPCLNRAGQNGILLVAESRSKTENEGLLAAFDRLMKKGSFYQAFDGLDIKLTFGPKSANAVGHQLADLCIGPIARYVSTGKADLAFKLALRKVYVVTGWQYGFKIFP